MKYSKIFLLIAIVTLNCSNNIKTFDLKNHQYDFIRISHVSGYIDSFTIKDGKFLCYRTIHNLDKNIPIGFGELISTESGLQLINKSCKLEPAFKKLKCSLESGSIVKVHTLKCYNEKKHLYTFQSIEK